jgi:hypothetical protein
MNVFDKSFQKTVTKNVGKIQINKKYYLDGSYSKIWNICSLTWNQSNFLNVGASVTEKRKDQLVNYLKSYFYSFHFLSYLSNVTIGQFFCVYLKILKGNQLNIVQCVCVNPDKWIIFVFWGKTVIFGKLDFYYFNSIKICLSKCHISHPKYTSLADGLQ